MNTGNAKPKNSKRNSTSKKKPSESLTSQAKIIPGPDGYIIDEEAFKKAADLSRDREVPHLEVPMLDFEVSNQHALNYMVELMMKHELTLVKNGHLEVHKAFFKPKEPAQVPVKAPTPEELEKEEEMDLFWSAK